MNFKMNRFFVKKYEWIFIWINLWKKTNESYYESVFFYLKAKQINNFILLPTTNTPSFWLKSKYSLLFERQKS